MNAAVRAYLFTILRATRSEARLCRNDVRIGQTNDPKADMFAPRNSINMMLHSYLDAKNRQTVLAALSRWQRSITQV